MSELSSALATDDREMDLTIARQLVAGMPSLRQPNKGQNCRDLAA